MRRHGGEYADGSGGNSYNATTTDNNNHNNNSSSIGGGGGGQMMRMEQQQQQQQIAHHRYLLQERLEAFTPERDPPPSYQPSSKPAEGRWRWERDEAKVAPLPNPMRAQVNFNEGQGIDASRSYFQGKRVDNSLLDVEKQGNNTNTNTSDPRFCPEDKPLSENFIGLEQIFIDDVARLAKEQNDAEDAENARHREKINSINDQYQEQLAALRARHASRREEFLHKESYDRQHRYQEAMMDRYPNSVTAPGNLRGYNGAAASTPISEAHQAYNPDHIESYAERARILGAARDQGFEPRDPYSRGRVYDASSRYY